MLYVYNVCIVQSRVACILYHKIFMYSVMQSDWNSFCGDVVLDSLNMEYSDDSAF